MTKRIVLTGLAAVFAGWVGLALCGDEKSQGKDEKKEFKHKFVGVANCKLCHSEAETGDQFAVWKKTKHAEALKTLSTPKAKELGQKAGVTDPSKDMKCLKCHVTGAEAPKDMKARTFKETDGVGCESCHGAGGDYAKDDVFKKGKEEAIKLGLVVPDEKVCVKCHNKESPSYKEFNFAKMAKDIAHPNPKNPKNAKK